MKHILIGTAGHVDHGKTSLLQALTGINTDRLEEEKKRGITIDLGFAYLPLPNGEKASIIDVPGHEKFIKNMLAGAGGMDFVLLVVAADDGVMPQTREHLSILQLLNAKDGVIVLTKCDLADDEWRTMVCEDIEAIVTDTFLKGAPIYQVSSVTKEGIEELRQCIFEKVERASDKKTDVPFRLPVDRVFSVDGFGTVITGTLLEGVLRLADTAMLYPGGQKTAKIRHLQVHGDDVSEAFAGQRVAVNLSGIHRDELMRGDVLAAPNTLQSTRMLDVKLNILPDSPYEIKNGSRLHFYYGTRNVLCKAVLLDANTLLPGDQSYAQLRFTEEVSVKKGDHFVLRFYSPALTIGGGVVLNETPKKHRQKGAKEALQGLKVREHGSLAERLQQAIADESSKLAPLADIQKHLGIDDATFETELNTLVEEGRITRLGTQNAMDENFRAALGQTISKLLLLYHKENPLQPGMRKEEFRSRILPGQQKKHALFDHVLQVYQEEHLLRINNGHIALFDFEISYSGEQLSIKNYISAQLEKGGIKPPSVDELLSAYPQKAAQQVLEAMLAEGSIISTEPGIVFSSASLENAKSAFAALAAENKDGVTLAQFRDATQTSRKYALSLLEFFDSSGTTRKMGDVRVLARGCLTKY